MQTSLFSGLSGLRAHQQYIDVIGSNLANVSTTGYRGSRATFADLISHTLSVGSRPTADFGGTNAQQIGLGTALASIDLNMRQGTFKDTGRSLDVALEGRGFFTLTDGRNTYYSRVGTFGVDANGDLIDLRNGFRVVGTDGRGMRVPVDDTLPAQATSNVEFTGSLPARVTGPLAEIVQSESPLLEGTAATQTAAPGSGSTYDLQAFLGKTVLVSVDGRSPRQVTFTAGMFGNPQAATASEVAAAFADLDDVLTVTADDGSGEILFETLRLGDAATLKFDEETGSTGLLAQLGLDSVMASGSQSAATAATDLADLTTRQQPYSSGDQIRVSGTNPDGSPFSATFVYGATRDGTTLDDLVTFIGGLIEPGAAELTLDASGNLVLTASSTGEAQLSLHIGDATTPARNAWQDFDVVQEGTGPDTAMASLDIYDSLGRAHAVQFTWERDTADPNVWSLRASMDPAEGTVTSGEIAAIRFGSDGAFQAVTSGSNILTFTFPGVAGAQSVRIDLGSAGSFDGVTMLGDQTTVAATDQDGFAAGTLLDAGFDQAGNLLAAYSNGQTRTLATLRIAMFQNEEGLLRTGDTLFRAAPNSDDAIATTAGAAGAGLVRPGSLENSNVDIAEEFVNLIEAQRGFQANSRVITTTDEILAELVNIVR